MQVYNILTIFFFPLLTFCFVSSGLENGTIVIWYLGSNETLKLSGHDQIHQLLLSPDKRYLASIDYFKKVIIWCTEVKDY
jgi:WD40 repeat protein